MSSYLYFQLPCLFGCRDNSDVMTHYVQCLLWMFLLVKFLLSPPLICPSLDCGTKHQSHLCKFFRMHFGSSYALKTLGCPFVVLPPSTLQISADGYGEHCSSSATCICRRPLFWRLLAGPSRSGASFCVHWAPPAPYRKEKIWR